MFAQIYEFQYLNSLPVFMGRRRSIDEENQLLDLMSLLAGVPERDDRRVWTRMNIRRKARVVAQAGKLEVVVTDACAWGFRIEGRLDLAPRQLLELQVRSGIGRLIAFPCQVMWTDPKGRMAGISLRGRPGARRARAFESALANAS